MPNGRVDLPLAGPELGALSAADLRIAGTPVSAVVDHTGHPTLKYLPAFLRPNHLPQIPSPHPVPRAPTAPTG
ncbi:hypothetical protein V2I01_23370 [Micromonospora sp. BRA006-A]|nr:hypothetical protein [Micromonospora sp. BRA006-A]